MRYNVYIYFLMDTNILPPEHSRYMRVEALSTSASPFPGLTIGVRLGNPACIDFKLKRR